MFNSNASAVSGDANYIEDVFSTYLYTGTNANLTITNNIDLSTKGGMVWIKHRTDASGGRIFDTSRGVTKSLIPSTTNAQATTATSLTAFNTTGFSLGDSAEVNNGGANASWTFREQEKFFDVVTYTGTGGSQTLNHNLKATPGCIIVKCTSAGSTEWYVYHRSLNDNSGNPYFVLLNGTAAQDTGGGVWGTPTSTQFTVQYPNASGQTYVAYLFAHDAGGFGLTGTDNVISCGYGTATAGGAPINVTLGYEPQYILMKNATAGGSWWVWDTMRGIGSFSTAQTLFANTAGAETTLGDSTYPLNITSTGFSLNAGYLTWGSAADKFIYIAIRKGPMKVPTTGTSVFEPVLYAGNNTNREISSSILTDLAIIKNRSTSANPTWGDRLRGSGYLYSNGTSAEASAVSVLTANPWDVQTGNRVGTGANATNASGSNYVDWMFRRAPSFMDVVCYNGSGVNATQTHNLQAVPEMMIMKKRDSANSWAVYHKDIANTEYLILNTTAAKTTGTNYWNSTTPTSSVFSVGTASATNDSGGTFVAHLFATCAGVSKVGSYTGTGTTLQVNCGFTAGSRFVMIKRADSTGDWYVWDSARGIVAGDDPYLFMNTDAAEVTGTDYVDTYAAGFELTSTAPAALNASGGTYIFLAIA
jgi:hypothetical protein